LPRDITEDYELADEELATRLPLNYGEAAIVLPGTGGNEDQVSRFFHTLYDGLPKDQRALARQLSFGQLPIKLCCADVVKPRETITSGLEWIRIAQLQPNADT